MSWQIVKAAILNYIKGAAFKAALQNLVKAAIKKVFKSASFGGIKGWLIKVFVKEVLIDKAIEPGVKAAFREAGYIYNVNRGKILISKLNRAEDENNQSDYDDTIDDIMR